MDKVYEDLLKKTIISFKGYRDALQKVEQIEGVRYKKETAQTWGNFRCYRLPFSARS